MKIHTKFLIHFLSIMAVCSGQDNDIPQSHQLLKRKIASSLKENTPDFSSPAHKRSWLMDSLRKKMNEVYWVRSADKEAQDLNIFQSTFQSTILKDLATLDRELLMILFGEETAGNESGRREAGNRP